MGGTLEESFISFIFSDEKTGSEKLSNLPKSAQQVIMSLSQDLKAGLMAEDSSAFHSSTPLQLEV